MACEGICDSIIVCLIISPIFLFILYVLFKVVYKMLYPDSPQTELQRTENPPPSYIEIEIDPELPPYQDK